MIVVDTNVIAYFFLPGIHSEKARSAFIYDPEWCAPLLWRSEFRNVLAFYIRKKAMSADTASAIVYEAEKLIESREYRISSSDVLSLISKSTCSAYDCEYVALAIELKTKLVTSDKQIIKTFPQNIISLLEYFK